MKKILINLFLTPLSVFLSLFIAEVICRMIFNPVDYLRPNIIKDDKLFYKIKPFSGGHDAWGFRNQLVPVSADIIAIGDSMTYGASVKASDSWPRQLQKMIKKNVYNLSAGGYGPKQYYILLKDRAFKLKPSVVIVSLYCSNDISDAYNAIHVPSNAHWEGLLRLNPFIREGADNSQYTSNADFLTSLIFKINYQLSGISVFYRLASYSGLGDFARSLAGKISSHINKNMIYIKVRNHNISTVFLLDPNNSIDRSPNNPQIEEGLKITLELFDKMKQMCDERNAYFLVVFIPSKESVFSDYFKNNRNLNIPAEIIKKIINEGQIADSIKRYFNEHHIAYIDTSDNLRNVVDRIQIYHNNHNVHPNKNGNKIIADSIRKYYLTNIKNID